MEHLRTLFDRFRQYDIIINAEKCQFGVESLEFLGRSLESKGIKPLSEKVSLIFNYQRPKSLRQLRHFLGLINFHRSFIQNCGKIAQTFTDLLRKRYQEYQTDRAWRGSY